MSAPVVDDIRELMRESPLVRIRMGGPASVWAKCEHLLPSGSLEDRVADAALAHLGSATVAVVASSGSSAAALAVAGKLRGVKIVAVMPRSMALEKRSLLRGLGCELVLTDAALGMDGARARAREIERERAIPEITLDAETGAEAAAREVVTALRGAPDVAVIGVGSGATLRAWASVLRAAGATRVIGVTATTDDTRIAGLAGPRVIAEADEMRSIDDARAWHTARRLAREEGLLVGPSAGACVAAACDVAATLPASARVATILGDTGERYFSIAQFFSAETRA